MHRLRSTALAGLATVGLLAGMAATAGAASAKPVPPPKVTFSVTFTNHDDGGHGTINGGHWAKDAFTANITLPKTGTVDTTKTDCGLPAGSSMHCYSYSGVTLNLTHATFTAIAGDNTPNQSHGPHSFPGERIIQYGFKNETGTFTGTATWSTVYSTSQHPSDNNLPAHGVNGDTPGIGDLAALSFPPGAKTAGISTYFFNYTGEPLLCTGHGVLFQFIQERWSDTSDPANQDGDAPQDGNITGSCPGAV
jgi:hypothetical protein